jgi:hypothetical protein
MNHIIINNLIKNKGGIYPIQIDCSLIMRIIELSQDMIFNTNLLTLMMIPQLIKHMFLCLVRSILLSSLLSFREVNHAHRLG